MGNSATRQVDIRPPTDVYDVFARLNYKPWYAIAEFVDNATQDYIDHQDELLSAQVGGPSGLLIEVDYDGSPPYELRISDNAHGMSSEDFDRALRLNARPENRDGRSEFGMGLKTAASWFSERWQVSSTMLGEPVRRTAVMDMADLRENQPGTITVEERPAPAAEHGTTLTLRPLRKPLYGRQIERIKRTLASMYREDLRRGDVAITYNGEPLTWEEPSFWEEERPDGTIREWRQEIELLVLEEATDVEHRVRGWVGILETMSGADSGFALLRRGRLIVGGPSAGWRPSEVVGAGGSHSYKRLVGELQMDSYPVNFSKDGFAWDGQLEEATIDAVAAAIADYRRKAADIRVRATKLTSKDLSAGTADIQERMDADEVRRDLARLETPVRPLIDPTEDPANRELILIETDGPMELVVPTPTGSLTARVYLKHGDPRLEWMELSFAQPDEVDVVLNTAHPFIVAHSGDESSLRLVQKIALTLGLAEKRARQLSTDARIHADDLRTHVDTFLKHFSR